MGVWGCGGPSSGARLPELQRQLLCCLAEVLGKSLNLGFLICKEGSRVRTGLVS